MAVPLFLKPGADGAIFSVGGVAVVSSHRRVNLVWLVWLDEQMGNKMDDTMAIAPGKQFGQRNLTFLI